MSKFKIGDFFIVERFDTHTSHDFRFLNAVCYIPFFQSNGTPVLRFPKIYNSANENWWNFNQFKLKRIKTTNNISKLIYDKTPL